MTFQAPVIFKARFVLCFSGFHPSPFPGRVRATKKPSFPRKHVLLPRLARSFDADFSLNMESAKAVLVKPTPGKWCELHKGICQDQCLRSPDGRKRDQFLEWSGPQHAASS